MMELENFDEVAYLTGKHRRFLEGAEPPCDPEILQLVQGPPSPSLCLPRAQINHVHGTDTNATVSCWTTQIAQITGTIFVHRRERARGWWRRLMETRPPYDYCLFRHVEGDTYVRVEFYSERSGLYWAFGGLREEGVRMYLQGYLEGALLRGATPSSTTAP